MVINKKIGFIGAGNMAKAIITGLINKKIILSADIVVYDIDLEKKSQIISEYSLSDSNSIQDLIVKSDYIIIAVKPQAFLKLSDELKNILFENKTVISIMAGINYNKLKNVFKSAEIIRTMPNTPSLIGEGMTGIYFENVSHNTKKDIETIFNSIGKSIVFSDEDNINAVTAISGSGPGYFFYIMEIFESLEKDFNISKDLILDMVYSTMKGSAELLKTSGKSPTELKNMVTSYKGTTAAALDEFQKNNFNSIFKNGIIAAYKRAIELSEEK
jgi:pyrroline-5-carboxylate reductase